MAIGLRGLGMVRQEGQPARGYSASFDRFRECFPLAQRIKRFRFAEANREFPGWQDHRDIIEVMLATVLMAEGFMRLDPQS